MDNPVDLSSRLALDVQSIDNLRLQAKTDPKGAIKVAAQQFEALFLNILLKNMRESVPQDSPFDSDQTRLFTQMMDQQLAQKMATEKGFGLADALVGQLARSTLPPTAEMDKNVPGGIPLQHQAQPIPLPSALPTPFPLIQPDAGGKVAIPPVGGDSRRDFVNRVWPHAVEAGRAMGIPPHFLAGQAALESGWGRQEILGADGSPSHNLFGIKAGSQWQGPVVHAMTTEYVNGVPEQKMEPFRAYASYAESFQDYANLLKNNPRYSAALQQSGDPIGFARELQRAGYATDPLYAEKLARVLSSASFRPTLAG
ncbi:MAG: flagellar assembly peptidoglycan hydrolase FlgJ [Burkholderiales bacterium]